jgi:hypothetical protein
MVDCRADVIEGMDAQLREGNAILGQYPGSEKIFCIIGVPGTRVLYGQANFVFDFGKPFKFCWNIEYLVSNRYFEYIIENGGVDRLVFADRPTYEWFVGKAQYASYASIATLATNPRETGPDFSP